MTSDPSDLQARIVNDFRFHPADEAKGKQHQQVRENCYQLAVLLVDLCPRGRELSLALTSLEQVMMWANAAMARSSAGVTATATIQAK